MSITTKAIRVHETGGPEVLRYEDVEVPAPQAGEVRLRHTVVGVNFIDTYHRSGQYPMKTPFVLGTEAAGVVEAVGPDVSGFNVGDRVVYCSAPLGSYSNQRVYPVAKLVRIPDGITDDVAASCFLKGLTAHYLLKQVYVVKPGETILVHAAAGGVGSILVQWAKSMGAKVIATVGSADKATMVRGLGADEVILYREESVPDRVRAITGGRGVPVVYDGVGKDTLMSSLDSLAPRGLLVSYGNASGPVEGFNLGLLASKGSLYVTRPTLFTFVAARADLERMASEVFAALQAGQFTVPIGGRYDLSAAEQAHRDLEGRRTTGALLLLPSRV